MSLPALRRLQQDLQAILNRTEFENALLREVEIVVNVVDVVASRSSRQAVQTLSVEESTLASLPDSSSARRGVFAIASAAVQMVSGLSGDRASFAANQIVGFSCGKNNCPNKGR